MMQLLDQWIDVYDEETLRYAYDEENYPILPVIVPSGLANDTNTSVFQ
jgi:hypothetical protein